MSVSSQAGGGIPLTASASSAYSSYYAASRAVDGDPTTFWAGAYAAPSWQLTLAADGDYDLSRMEIDWAYGYVPTDYDVEVSRDGVNFTPLLTGLSESPNPVAGASFTRTSLALSGAATHVRLTIRAALYGLPLVTEVRIEGSQAPITPASFRPFQAVAMDAVSPSARAIGVKAADMNGDGLTDVLLSLFDRDTSGYAPKLAVLLQLPGGALDTPVVYDVPGPYYALSFDTGDWNGDGFTDVVAVSYRHGVVAWAGSMDGTLSYAGEARTGNDRIVRLGDVDGDGLDDVVTAGWSTQTIDVYYQAGGALGAATVIDVRHSGFEDLVLADVTGDGLTDVVLQGGYSTSEASLAILAQSAAGGLDAPVYHDVVGQSTAAIAVGDVDGDGLNDVITGAYANPGSIAVFRQGAAGMLEAPESTASVGYARALRTADPNSDGRTDVVARGRSGAEFVIHHQERDGTLLPAASHASAYTSYTSPDTLAIADVNGDGKPDVLEALYSLGDLVVHPGE
jgi:hypothetical protein